MPASTSSQTERHVRFARRQLWVVLAFLLALGLAFVLDLANPSIDLHIAPALNVLFVIAIAVLNPLKGTGLNFSKSDPALQALHNDELRQLARAKAFRNGFFVLLAYPPLCAVALTALSVNNPLPILVETGAWLGAVTCLASLLWYDR